MGESEHASIGGLICRHERLRAHLAKLTTSTYTHTIHDLAVLATPAGKLSPQPFIHDKAARKRKIAQ